MESHTKVQSNTQQPEIPPTVKKAMQPGESLFWSDKPPYNGAWVATRRLKDRFGKELPAKRKSSRDIKVISSWFKEQRDSDSRQLGSMSDQTLKAWFDYLKEKEWPQKLKLVTIENKSQRWTNHIEPYLGHVVIKNLDKMKVRDWLSELENKKKVDGITPAVGIATITECRRDLHAMMATAVDVYEFLDRNPCTKITTKEAPKRTKRTITPKQAREAIIKGLNLVEDKSIPAWIVGMASTSFMAGLRRGEAQALTHEQLDRERMVIKVTQAVQRETAGHQIIGLPKANKTREVPLTPGLLNIIDATTTTTEGFLWPTERTRAVAKKKVIPGQPKPSNAVIRWWKIFVTKTGLPEGMVYRDTRSTYASWLNELNLGTKTVMDILGHSTYQVTADKYIETTDQAMIEARNRIEKLVVI